MTSSLREVAAAKPAELLTESKDKDKIRALDFERRYQKLEEEPDFLESIMTSRVSVAMRAIPDDVKSLPQSLLEEKVQPDFTGRMLRQAFWLEFDRVCRCGDKKFILANVYNGLTNIKSFYRDWVDNSFKLEYLLRPPPELQVAWEEMTYKATQEVNKILEYPVEDANGKPNVKLMELKLKAFQYLADRRRGHVLGNARLETIAHKSQMQVQMVVNQLQQKAEHGEPLEATAVDPTSNMSLAETEAEIQRLQTKLLNTPPKTADLFSQVIDVEAKEKV